jgi:hypothetical protein
VGMAAITAKLAVSASYSASMMKSQASQCLLNSKASCCMRGGVESREEEQLVR